MKCEAPKRECVVADRQRGDQHQDHGCDVLEAPIDGKDRQLDEIAGTLVDDGEAEVGRFELSTLEEGRLMAVFSYFSVVFGIPVFLVSLHLRDNAFALHHAKAAGVAYTICTAMLVLAVTNWALFLPLVFVCYIPALIGTYRASAGVEAGTSALGPAGEYIFQWIEVKE